MSGGTRSSHPSRLVSALRSLDCPGPDAGTAITFFYFFHPCSWFQAKEKVTGNTEVPWYSSTPLGMTCGTSPSLFVTWERIPGESAGPLAGGSVSTWSQVEPRGRSRQHVWGIEFAATFTESHRLPQSHIRIAILGRNHLPSPCSQHSRQAE